MSSGGSVDWGWVSVSSLTYAYLVSVCMRSVRPFADASSSCFRALPKGKAAATRRGRSAPRYSCSTARTTPGLCRSGRGGQLRESARAPASTPLSRAPARRFAARSGRCSGRIVDLQGAPRSGAEPRAPTRARSYSRFAPRGPRSSSSSSSSSSPLGGAAAAREREAIRASRSAKREVGSP